MAAIGGSIASTFGSGGLRTLSKKPHFRRRVSCIGWDPEGVLGPPKGGHIARFELRQRLEKDAKVREDLSRQVREEQERRRALREARVQPETNEGLVEYLLDTEARDIEFEIARLRPRLTKDFFESIQIEIAKQRFAVSRTKEIEDRLIELEAMQKVLLEGTEAYDSMVGDLVLAKERLKRILQSKDRNSTLLEMVERNELSRSVLALLDENIADALKNDQKAAADFLETVRSAILKYITV